MLFVWTSEGGPLQYLGLGIFLLQLAPHLFPAFERLFNEQQTTSWVVGLLVGVLTAAFWKLGTTAVRQRLEQWTEQARVRLQEATGREWSYYTVPALLGVALGCLITLGSTVDAVRWLPYLGQLVALLSMLGVGRRGQQRQRHHHNNVNPAVRQAKLEAMTTLVRSMPLEPFVTEEDTATTASISQLKQMLQRRGTSQAELDSFVERQNLVDALQTKRQYSDTCCICFEDLVKDEPMRILPNCCHELHVECLDKWVYTFATNAAKLHQDPTCPLCKETMK